jgi:hypothetical protein
LLVSAVPVFTSGFYHPGRNLPALATAPVAEFLDNMCLNFYFILDI